MGGTTYYQKNKDVILKRIKDCYENNKEDWEIKQKVDIETYLKKKKNKKRKYGKNRYYGISEENKQKLKEYKKKLSQVKKVSM